MSDELRKFIGDHFEFVHVGDKPKPKPAGNASCPRPCLDRVWYWVGGIERGEWREVTLELSTLRREDSRRQHAENVRRGVANMGYHAIIGSSTVGPPEGPPQVRDPECLCACCYEPARSRP